jgi:hypothetical protein
VIHVFDIKLKKLKYFICYNEAVYFPLKTRFKLSKLIRMSTAMNNCDKNMSLCIPRAFENISDARVRTVFEKLDIFTIDRVDFVLRKNEKGDAYKRFFIHIKEWRQTSDAQKAKERLLSGKELKIVYDDPWFWKVGLNTWAPKPQQQKPLLNDRKPRIRIEFDEDQGDKNVKAATNFLSNLSLEERDRRPYSERRLDPAYCEQDVKQGFRDRRELKENKDKRVSRFTPRSPSSSPPRTKPIITTPKPQIVKEEQKIAVEKPVITTPKPQKPVIQEVKPVIQEVKSEFKMNPDIRLMVATFHGIGRDEVTEELYKNTSQFVRDLRQDDMDRQKDEDAELGKKPLNYSGLPAEPPKRKRGKIVESNK